MLKQTRGTARPMRRLGAVVAAAGLLAVVGCSKSSPPTASSLLAEGIKAQLAGDMSTAASKFNAVIKIDPKNKVAYYDLALIQQNQDNTTAADANYRSAIAIDANYAPALYNLGIIRSNAGAQAEAVDLYTRSTVADPKSAPAFLNLGLLLDTLGQVAAGKAALKTAVQLDPTLASRIPAAQKP
jgi:tetratricopeptide (TPR) repeat protein